MEVSNYSQILFNFVENLKPNEQIRDKINRKSYQ